MYPLIYPTSQFILFKKSQSFKPVRAIDLQICEYLTIGAEPVLSNIWPDQHMPWGMPERFSTA